MKLHMATASRLGFRSTGWVSVSVRWVIYDWKIVVRMKYGKDGFKSGVSETRG